MAIGRGRRREHTKNTKGVAQLPVAHAHTQGNPEEGSSDLRSHPVAMLLLLRKKNAGGKSRSCAEHTSGQDLFRSREFVTSGQKGPTRADMAQLPVAHAHNIFSDM